MRDTRIAFGASCTWWGPIQEVAKGSDTGMGVPSCPFCNGVLYEAPTKGDWDARLRSVETYGSIKDYRKVMEWQHDNLQRCFASWDDLKRVYDNRKPD